MLSCMMLFSLIFISGLVPIGYCIQEAIIGHFVSIMYKLLPLQSFWFDQLRHHVTKNRQRLPPRVNRQIRQAPRGAGASGHFDSGGLAWLINDRDESGLPLSTFSSHRCSCNSHTRDPPCPPPLDCLEWLSWSDVTLIFPPAHDSSYKIHLAHFVTWIRSSKYLQTHAAHETAFRALDDKPIILKARRAGFCSGHLHNFKAMTYWFSCYLSQACV